eukprot:600601-Prorocentrum_lima.AAC.1
MVRSASPPRAGVRARNTSCQSLSMLHNSVIGRSRLADRTGASFGSIGTSAPCHTGGRREAP